MKYKINEIVDKVLAADNPKAEIEEFIRLAKGYKSDGQGRATLAKKGKDIEGKALTKAQIRNELKLSKEAFDTYAQIEKGIARAREALDKKKAAEKAAEKAAKAEAKATKDAEKAEAKATKDAEKAEAKVEEKKAEPKAPKKESKPMNKTQKRANGYFGSYRKAQNAGDKAKMRAASAEIRKLGFKVTKNGLVKLEAAEKPAAEKKPAAKKAAAKKPATKKAAAKKPATKKAAAKKKPAAKAAPKKVAAKKTTAKGRKVSRKNPGFPAASKGAKVQSKAASTTYKTKEGRVVTKTVTRTYRTNPMGEVGTFATMALFGVIGAVGSDWLDRFVATMPVEGSDKPLSGVEASTAIIMRPNGKRLGAQGGLFVILAGFTYLLAKKNKRTASIIFGAMALGVLIRTGLQAINAFGMPMALPSSKDASKPSLGDRLYPGEQEGTQKDLETMMSAYSAKLKAASRAAGGRTHAEQTAPAGQGGKLAGISSRLGGTAQPSTLSSTARPAMKSPANHPALPPATEAQRRPQKVAGALASEQEQHGAHSKLGCGGPSCGPSCGCAACKAQWGDNPLSVLFAPPSANANNQGSQQMPQGGARPVPQLGAPNVVSFVPRAHAPQRRTAANAVGFRG